MHLARTIGLIFLAALLGGIVLAVLLNRAIIGVHNAGLAAVLTVLILLIVPVATILVWSHLRRKELEQLNVHARELAAGQYDTAVPRPSFGEVLEISEAIQELGERLREKNLHEHTVAVLGEILNGMGEGLLAIDKNRRVALANRKFGELVGVTPQVGRPLLEVVRNNALVRAFDVALKGTPTVTRASFHVSGEERQLEMRIFPMTRSAEVAAVALLIDVTRIVRLETMRRDFLADFSHEVRTPLAGIRAAVETLETRKLDSEQERQLRRVIGRQLSRLERLLDDIKQLSEIEAGEVVLQKQPIDLRDLLSDLCDDFSDRVDSGSIQLSVSGATSLIDVDATRIQQVFANLIDNALKHAAGASEVRVEVEDRTNESVARVIDNGAGIAVEDQERIFNRFYRADPSRSQTRAGTGLGLAIVKHLVLLHGGTIDVRSAPGSGATFEVRLPKSQKENWDSATQAGGIKTSRSA